MSHDIVKDVGLETYYCKKCCAHTEDLLSKLCKSALHEEQLKIETENKKMVIDSQIENITAAIQNLIVISKSVYEKCSKGGWLRLIKSLFHQQI